MRRRMHASVSSHDLTFEDIEYDPRRDVSLFDRRLHVCCCTLLVIVIILFILFVAAVCFVLTPNGKRFIVAQMFESISYDDPEHDRIQYGAIAGQFPFSFTILDTHFRSENLETIAWAPAIDVKMNPLWLPISRTARIYAITVPYLLIPEARQVTTTTEHRGRTIVNVAPQSETTEELQRQPDVSWPSLGAVAYFDHFKFDRVRLVNDSVIIALSKQLLKRSSSTVRDLSFMTGTRGNDYELWGNANIFGRNGNWKIRTNLKHVSGIRVLNVVDGFIQISGTASTRVVDIEAELNGVLGAQCGAQGVLHARGDIQSIAAIASVGVLLKNGPVHVSHLAVTVPSVRACGNMPFGFGDFLGQGSLTLHANGYIDRHREIQLNECEVHLEDGQLTVNGSMGRLLKPQTWPRHVVLRVHHVRQRPNATFMAECVRSMPHAATCTITLTDPLTQTHVCTRVSYTQFSAGYGGMHREVQLAVFDARALGYVVDASQLSVKAESVCLGNVVDCPLRIRVQIRGYGTASVEIEPARARIVSFSVEMVAEDFDNHFGKCVHFALDRIRMEGTLQHIVVVLDNVTAKTHALVQPSHQGEGYREKMAHALFTAHTERIQLDLYPDTLTWSLQATGVGEASGYTDFDILEPTWSLVSDRGHFEAWVVNGTEIVPATHWEDPHANRIRYQTLTNTIDMDLTLLSEEVQVKAGAIECVMTDMTCGTYDLSVDLPISTLYKMTLFVAAHSGRDLRPFLPITIHTIDGAAHLSVSNIEGHVWLENGMMVSDELRVQNAYVQLGWMRRKPDQLTYRLLTEHHSCVDCTMMTLRGEGRLEHRIDELIRVHNVWEWSHLGRRPLQFNTSMDVPFEWL